MLLHQPWTLLKDDKEKTFTGYREKQRDAFSFALTAQNKKENVERIIQYTTTASNSPGWVDDRMEQKVLQRRTS